MRPSAVPSPASLLDLTSREFWRRIGRPVDLDGTDSWLAAPASAGARVGDGWLRPAAESIGGTVRENVDNAGLLPDLAVLDGPAGGGHQGFAATDLHPLVRDFYAHTSRWRMEVWTEWNPLFQPGGELISRLFGKRVQQLALPTRPLQVAKGMDSRIVVIADRDGQQIGAAWLRTLRATGEYVYSGQYSARLLPGAPRPSVHVAFPLQDGNVQVFLRPDVGPGGSLLLTSPGGQFGGDGAYVVVRSRGRTYAARAPIREQFRVYVDDIDEPGVLRTDHRLALGGATAVRLHYKLSRHESR